MTVRQRRRQLHLIPDLETPSTTFGGTGSESPAASVLVSSGIHRGHYPIAGLTVRAARRLLASHLSIDPAAVAVINGQIVDDDTVLNAEQGLLSFVKPSSLKG
jgi:hypothetical protein